jgi:hypothetical protein
MGEYLLAKAECRESRPSGRRTVRSGADYILLDQEKTRAKEVEFFEQ